MKTSILCYILLSYYTYASFAAFSHEGKPLEPTFKEEALQNLKVLQKMSPPSPQRPKISYQLKENVYGKHYRPVVLMHGIRGDITSMMDVERWIKEELPSIYVRRIQVGNGFVSEMSTELILNSKVGFHSDAHEQPSERFLSTGFNVIGYSQGSLVTRGFIQRCNQPPVYNYISWAGPQAGLFGTPFIDSFILDEYLGSLPYWGPVQRDLAPAQFWKDPYSLDDYLESSLFLADINNERTLKNQTYKEHIISLQHMVLIYSTEDEVVHPRESGWFYFYEPETENLLPLQKSVFYKEDWIGIRTLDEKNKLYFGKTNCSHTEFNQEPCKEYFKLHTMPFLNNTLNGISLLD